jgi:hypothetical protein
MEYIPEKRANQNTKHFYPKHLGLVHTETQTGSGISGILRNQASVDSPIKAGASIRKLQV